jgi:pyridoxamine 5'-phosphate oxidase
LDRHRFEVVLIHLATSPRDAVSARLEACCQEVVVLPAPLDAASAKLAELQANPAVELAWLLPKARAQFRLRGHRLQLSSDEERQALERHWQALTPRARALWSWPAPGEPLQAEGPFPREVEEGAPRPEHFELLRVQLQRVELLELLGHPHRRRCWRAANAWQEEWLNP